MTEFDITQRMIEVVLRAWGLGGSRNARPGIVTSESSEIERPRVDEAVRSAGGKGVVLVEEALRRRDRGRLPIPSRRATWIVDIGGGTT